MDRQSEVRCTAFRSRFEDLVIGITDPSTVAVKLYTKGMISQNQLEEVTRGAATTKPTNTTLMLAVQRKIEVDSKHFNVFCGILLEEPVFEYLGRKLQDTYGKNCMLIIELVDEC